MYDVLICTPFSPFFSGKTSLALKRIRQDCSLFWHSFPHMMVLDPTVQENEPPVSYFICPNWKKPRKRPECSENSATRKPEKTQGGLP
jgi:hypothetical protein